MGRLNHWLMGGLWIGAGLMLWPGVAGGCPDVEETIGPVFTHPQAIWASESFGVKNYLQAAEQADKALQCADLRGEERPYLLFLQFLALDRGGQHRRAEQPLQALLTEGVPEDLSAHVNWYQARALLFRPGNPTDEEKRVALALLEKVPPMGRFGRVAHSIGLRWALSMDPLELGCQRAAELSDQWRGWYAEAEALLLLSQCQERLASQQKEKADLAGATVLLGRAAALYQEIALWWPASAPGVSAKRALLALKMRGIKPAPLDEGRILERARIAVRYLRNRKTMHLLSRVREDLPSCPASPLCHELDLLTAQVATVMRDLKLTERIYQRVATRSPLPEQRARAEMGLAWLTARQSLIKGTEAYLGVEQRWPRTAVAPLALYQAGELARRVGNERGAADAYLRCAEKYPERTESASCVFGLGWLAWRSGSLEDARLWFEELLVSRTAAGLDKQSAPKAADKDEIGSSEWFQKVRYWHARVQEALGEKDPARQSYRDLVLGRPYGFYALLAWERLGGMGRGLEFASEFSAPAARMLQKAVYGVLRREGAATRRAEDSYEDFFCDPRTPAERASGEIQATMAYLRMRLFDEARATLLTLRPAELTRLDRRLAALAFRVMGDYQRSHRMAPLTRDGGLPGFPEGDLLLEAELAYPKAFDEVVEGPARAPEVPAALLFALIRTESAFQSSAESPAKALGLTQVIRGTAEETARALGLPRFRFRSLVEPETAVRIGSAYLGQLIRQFDGNFALAAAAYNAGASSVKRWLTRQGDVPIDVFVEEIPFLETNLYVRTVLTSYAIYRALYDEPAGPPLGIAFKISRALWDRLVVVSSSPGGARKPG